MKFILSTILMIALALQGYSQEPRDFIFGMKGSPNFGWIKPNSNEIEKDGVGGRLGFGYGVTLDVPLYNSANYYFSTGFEVASSGGKLVHPGVIQQDTLTILNKYERTYKLRYINIPITIKMRTNQIGYITYYGQFGVDASFNISAKANDKYDFKTTTSLPNEESNLDINDDIRLLRAALVIGAGAEYNVSGNTNLVFGLSWHNGFINILDGKSFTPDNNGFGQVDSNGDPLVGSKLKAINNYISLDIGVLF